MTFYRVTPGESPAMIARKLGTSVSALIGANSHKPTTVVAGKRTFQALRFNELLHKPRAGVGALGESGTLGITPADPAAPHALIAQGSTGADVALWQKILGVAADGVFGSGTDAATKKWQTAHGLNPDGKVGQNTWAKALGNASSAPVPTAAAAPAGASLAMAAGAAYTALNQDPNYCTSVARAGTPVNTAVHNFKAAWNAANPSRAVPIGTGKYEPVVASALSSALGGVTVPAGCGGAAAATPQPSPVAPSAPAPMPEPTVTPVPTPAPTASSAYSGAQIAAATAMNSALSAHGYKQADQGLYMAFQRAMGLTADGYPGTGTMGKLRAVLASAGIPMASVPIYPWRAGAWDGTNAPTAASWSGAAATPTTSPVVTPPPPPSSGGIAPPPPAPSGGGAAPAAAPPGSTTPVAAGGGTIVPPTPSKKLSTGAIVVGAIGAAALVGLVAMAATGKKKGHRGARGARGPARRKSSKRKPAHHAHPSHPKRKKKSKKK